VQCGLQQLVYGDHRTTFRPDGAIAYDPRILSWKGPDPVALLTQDGRQTIPIVLDAYHRARMNRRQGYAELL